MAGIYLHIPYCKQACHYCDFHFSVKQETKAALVNSLCTEISLQKNYLGGEPVETIYFGGGTPSLLSKEELDQLFETLFLHFSISRDPEITLEANPDDLTAEKIRELRDSPVNRLSIGVQSFIDRDLRWMNRAHTAHQADESIRQCQEAGFSNLTIDLIYGLPDSGHADWEQNLRRAFALDVQHLSCYSLTVEPRTALAHFIKTGQSKKHDEEQAAEQFEILTRRMKANGWLHYEISNFSRNEKFISKHNSSYWFGKKYLGLGPSAHSFNGLTRQWNVRNNRRYTESLAKGIIPFEKETLTEIQRINERLMTELRTMWGFKIGDGGNRPPDEQAGFADKLLERSKKFSGYLEMKNGSLRLTDRGKLIADRIILELMVE